MNKNTTTEIILKQLDKIEQKVDKLDTRLDAAEKVAIKQEANLAEHMRRTDLLERQQEKMNEKIKPLLSIQAGIFTVGKIFAGLSFLAGFLAALAKIAAYLF